MTTFTADQFKAMENAQYELVLAGYDPATAGGLVRRAAIRILEGPPTLGEFRMHRFVRTTPRPIIAGEQCVRIDMIPGSEEEREIDFQKYRDMGWNIMQIETMKDQPVWYACPPGQMPRTNQPKILQSERW